MGKIMVDYSKMTDQELINLASGGQEQGQPQVQGMVPQIGKLNIKPEYWDYIQDSAIRHGVDPHFVLGVMAVESGGRPRAESKKGARGLMQLMGPTAMMLGVKDVWNPQENIEGGTKLLANLLKKHGGDPQKALWEYNAGGQSLASGKMPSETSAYIPEVLKAYQQALSRSGQYNVATSPTPEQMGIEIASPQMQTVSAQSDLSKLSDEELMKMVQGGKPQVVQSPPSPPVSGQLAPTQAYTPPVDVTSETLGLGQHQTVPFGPPLSQESKNLMITTGLSGLGGIAGGLVNPMLGRVGAGLGYTAGKIYERGRLPSSEEALVDMGIGYGSQWLGDKVTKIFLPATEKLMSKVPGELKPGLGWLGEKELPIGAEISTSLWDKAKQALSEMGLGSFMADRYRKKTINAVSSAATEMIEQAGIETTRDTGFIAGNALRSLAAHDLTYSGYNKAIQSLPKDLTIEVPTLINQIDKLGGIEKVLKGFKADSQSGGATFKRVLEETYQTGKMTVEQLDAFGKLVRKAAKDRNLAAKIKDGWISDMETVITPGGENIGLLRKEIDKATAEAHAWLTDFSQKNRLIFRPQEGKPWLVTKEPEKAIEQLFDPKNADTLEMFRNQLVTMGREDIWESVKTSYVKSIFDKTTPLITKPGGLQYRTFQPDQFSMWFEKNGEYLSKVMPEQYPALQQWYGLSKATASTFEKGLREKNPLAEMAKLGGGVAGIGALGNLALWSQSSYGLTGLIAANAFVPFATWAVMGPKSLASSFAKPIGIAAQTGALMTSGKIQQEYEKEVSK